MVYLMVDLIFMVNWIINLMVYHWTTAWLTCLWLTEWLIWWCTGILMINSMVHG